jgi:hypothetical protein
MGDSEAVWVSFGLLPVGRWFGANTGVWMLDEAVGSLLGLHCPAPAAGGPRWCVSPAGRYTRGQNAPLGLPTRYRASACREIQTNGLLKASIVARSATPM